MIQKATGFPHYNKILIGLVFKDIALGAGDAEFNSRAGQICR